MINPTKFKRYSSYKDSCVEWLGEIPAHWNVDKHTRRFHSAMGQPILRENLVTGGKVPVYSATESGAIFGWIDNPAIELNVGDIVIPARGVSIGHPVLAKKRITCTQTTIYSKLIDHKEIYSPFVIYWMVGHRNSLSYYHRTAIPQITVDQVSSNPLPIPPLTEQRTIVAYLDSETTKIDALMAKVRAAIDRLKELRTALISGAVTGKIDVLPAFTSHADREAAT